jgi:hypothetical protein
MSSRALEGRRSNEPDFIVVDYRTGGIDSASCPENRPPALANASDTAADEIA